MNEVRRWTPDSEGVMCEDSRDMLFATVGRDSYVLAYDYDMLKADYAVLKAERDELSSDLQNYGAHHMDCTIWTATYDERCSCGLNAALARLTAKEKP